MVPVDELARQTGPFRFTRFEVFRVATAMPGGFYSSETPESCWRELTETVLPALTGRTFPHVAALDAWLRDHTTTPFVRVAVETAAWEMIARAGGLSLRALFGLADRPI